MEILDNFAALFSGAIIEWGVGMLLVFADIAAVAFIIKKLHSLERLLDQEIKRHSSSRKLTRNFKHSEPLLSGSPLL